MEERQLRLMEAGLLESVAQRVKRRLGKICRNEEMRELHGLPASHPTPGEHGKTVRKRHLCVKGTTHEIAFAEHLHGRSMTIGSGDLRDIVPTSSYLDTFSPIASMLTPASPRIRRAAPASPASL